MDTELRTLRLPALLLAFALLAPGLARAESDALRAAIGHYEFGEYEEACRGLSEALALGIPDLEERTRARRYLASAWHVRGEIERARKVIELLLAEDPKATVDPALFPPRFVELFEQVRRALPAPAPEAKPEPPPPDDKPLAVTPVEPVVPHPPPPPLVLAPPAREPPSLALAFVPFGVGQFANDSPKKGAFFLTSEVLAFGAFAVALTAFESQKLPGSPGAFQCTDADPCRFADATSAGRLQTTYLVSFYTGLALAAVGIADAIIENRSLAESP